MAGDRQGDTPARAATPRRRVLAAAALAPILAGAGASAAQTPPGMMLRGRKGRLRRPMRTNAADWVHVADELGRPGGMTQPTVYHTAFPRRDLDVRSYGIGVTPALALGTHVAFVRYHDGGVLLMGEVVVTERELQRVSDTLHRHGIGQTAIHKHLLAHTPQIWWTHVHAHGHDSMALARGLRAALDHTGTPDPGPSDTPDSSELDTARIDAALGVKGSMDGDLHKCVFVRRETITDGDLVLPRGLGSTTSFNFQPLGDGRAALSGDLALVASEVHRALGALRRAGVNLVELHNHGLMDEPRLFFVHFWAVGDAVELARALRPAVEATGVVPAHGQGAA